MDSILNYIFWTRIYTDFMDTFMFVTFRKNVTKTMPCGQTNYKSRRSDYLLNFVMICKVRAFIPPCGISDFALRAMIRQVA